MSIIKKTIENKGQDINLKIGLTSNNNLSGLQDSIDDFVTEETGLSVNDVDDGEKTRFTIDGGSRRFNWLFSSGFTTTGTRDGGNKSLVEFETGEGGFFDAGFFASDITGLDEVFLRSFFIMQIFDSNNIEKQTQLHIGYFNGLNIIRKENLYDTSFLIGDDDEFGDIYIPNSFTGSTVYMKTFFYNAKTGRLHLFQNQGSSGSTLESKLYFDVILLRSSNTWSSDTLDFSEIVNTNYVDNVNETLDSFRNEKPTYPTGNTFTSGGTYTII